MNKNFVKIILIAVAFVGMFFVGDNAKALDCCLIKTIDGTPKDCRVKGDTTCNTTQKCGIIDYDENGREYCKNSTANTIEEQKDCKIDTICKDAAIKALINCNSLKSLDDCGLKSSLCFWSTNSNACFSLSDVNNCPGFNQADCGKVKACNWEGDRCLNPFLKGVSDQYTKGYSEEKYKLFQSCVLDGSCRSLSNILYTVLKIVEEIFKYIGAIAFIFFVFGGFTMILSFGNAEKFKKGQQVLVAAVIGLIIVFGAYLMISFVLDALGVAKEFKAIK